MKASYSESAVHSRPGLDYYGEARPARETGRDFFDFLSIGCEGLVCSIGRINGSGIGASFAMASLQAFLRGLTRHHRGTAAEIVNELNRTVCEISPDNFYASLFYAWIDPARGEVVYVNAGHEPVLLLSGADARVRRLENTGTVLGLSPRMGYRQRTVALEPGDLLLAATDGVTGALCEDDIVAMLYDFCKSRPVDLVVRVLDAAASAEDCAALAVRLKGPSARLILEEEAAELAMAAA
jgi:sigma-B regulation protein RsbU (phosphoserine phosphatase)